MRLTRTLRENFVQDVLKRIPCKHRYTDDQLREDTRKLALSLLPEDAQRVIARYPKLAVPRVKCVPIDDEGHYSCITFYGDQELSDSDIAPFLEKMKASRTEANERLIMRRRLLDIAGSVTTVNALKELLPELAHLLPSKEDKAEKKLPVPVNGIITELKAMGLEG